MLLVLSAGGVSFPGLWVVIFFGGIYNSVGGCGSFLCGGVLPEPEIGLEALALPTSRQLMAVGHDYHQKAPMKMNISHFGVCGGFSLPHD